MRVATFVDGVLLAVIIFVWMWTWWWNRRVIHARLEPDYEAATAALTAALIRHRFDLLSIEKHRADVARAVTDAGSRLLERDLTPEETDGMMAKWFAEYYAAIRGKEKP
jgi:hypothetical protein